MATAAIQRQPDDGITFKAGQNVTHAVEQALEPAQPLPGLPDHDASTHWLNVSPYPEPEHLLDLQSLGTPCRLLALALTTLAPATTDYASTKYQDAIDWRSVMSRLRSLAQRDGYTWTRQEFYVVDFRSKLMRDIDVDLLFKLDKLSHVEATQSGGLLKYWYGVPDGDRRNHRRWGWQLELCAVLKTTPFTFGKGIQVTEKLSSRGIIHRCAEIATHSSR